MSRQRSWRDLAACSYIAGDDWFPEARARINPQLLRVCAGCPVWRECLLFTLAHPDIWHGIWAGLTAAEIATLRLRLLTGELGADVIEEARRIARDRDAVTVYMSAAPHPVPSDKQLRRQQRHVLARLRAVGLLDHTRRRGTAA